MGSLALGSLWAPKGHPSVNISEVYKASKLKKRGILIHKHFEES